MLKELAVFITQYDILIIGLVLAVYTLFAIHVTYKEEELHIKDPVISEMYPKLLENLPMIKEFLNRYYKIWYMISMLLIIGTSFISTKKPEY